MPPRLAIDNRSGRRRNLWYVQGLRRVPYTCPVHALDHRRAGSRRTSTRICLQLLIESQYRHGFSRFCRLCAKSMMEMSAREYPTEDVFAKRPARSTRSCALNRMSSSRRVGITVQGASFVREPTTSSRYCSMSLRRRSPLRTCTMWLATSNNTGTVTSILPCAARFACSTTCRCRSCFESPGTWYSSSSHEVSRMVMSVTTPIRSNAALPSAGSCCSSRPSDSQASRV